MGAENSVGRRGVVGGRADCAQDIIVIDSSDEDFQRPEPPRQKRSLALRVVAGDVAGDIKPENSESDCGSGVTSTEKRRRTFPADGSVRSAPVVDLRPLLHQAKLRVRLPDGSYIWPPHLRMNIVELENRRLELVERHHSQGGNGGEEEDTIPPSDDVDEEEKAQADESTTMPVLATPRNAAAQEKVLSVLRAPEGASRKDTLGAATRERLEVMKVPAPPRAPHPDGHEKMSAPSAPSEALRNRHGEQKAPAQPSAAIHDDGTEDKAPAPPSAVIHDGGTEEKAPAVPSEGEEEKAGSKQQHIDEAGDDEVSDLASGEEGSGEEEVSTRVRPQRYNPNLADSFESPSSDSSDSDFEDEEEVTDLHGVVRAAAAPSRQIGIAVSRATMTGGMSPARWPSDVVHLRAMYNPANIQLEYAYNFGVCLCEVVCSHTTCMNANLGLFCTPNRCAFRGNCDNVLKESPDVAIATRGGN